METKLTMEFESIIMYSPREYCPRCRGFHFRPPIKIRLEFDKPLVPSISRIGPSLFYTWARSTTIQQVLQDFTLKSKTPHPDAKDFLKHIFDERRKLVKQDEKNGNICAICFEAMSKYEPIKPCQECKKSCIHDQCLRIYMKTMRKTECPMCRHNMGDRYGVVRNRFHDTYHQMVMLAFETWGVLRDDPGEPSFYLFQQQPPPPRQPQRTEEDLDENEIRTAMYQADVSRDLAVESLLHNEHIVDAILELTS